MILHTTTGGNPLNFRVTGGLALPDTPRENTVWVNTGIPIPLWSFRSDVPENPVEGMVHFTTAARAAVGFDALKKNEVYVYPTGCTQYVGGAWQYREFKIFRNGAWQSSQLVLYKDGQFSEIGGSLTQKPISYGGKPGWVGIYQQEDWISIRSDSGSSGLAYFPDLVDLTPYKTLCFSGLARINHSGGGHHCGIGVWDASFQPVALLEGMRSDGLHTLDISSVNGVYYLGIAVQGFTDYTECILRELYLR